MDYKTKTDYAQDVADADNSVTTTLNGKRCVVFSRTRLCTILFAAVVLFTAMLLVAVVPLHLRYGQIHDELEEHKKMLEHLMRNDADRYIQETAPHISSISKRYANRGRSHRGKRQNRAFGACNSEVRQCISSELSKQIARLHILAKKPRIHLVGNNQYADGNTFKWDLKFSTESEHIRYDPYDGCVLILRAGSYHVYSQMLINGIDENISPPNHYWYGHKTVRKRPTELTPTTLMRSLVTPFNRGQTYYAAGPNLHRAADTLYQAGVFNFHVDDKICVQKLANSQHVRYRLDPEDAFFGMKMENPHL